MTPETLRRVGKALYGTQYQTDLSLALNRNVRTIRAWLSGQNPIPADLRDDLRRVVHDKRSQLLEMLELLE